MANTNPIPQTRDIPKDMVELNLYGYVYVMHFDDAVEVFRRLCIVDELDTSYNNNERKYHLNKGKAISIAIRPLNSDNYIEGLINGEKPK